MKFTTCLQRRFGIASSAIQLGCCPFTRSQKDSHTPFTLLIKSVIEKKWVGSSSVDADTLVEAIAACLDKTLHIEECIAAERYMATFREGYLSLIGTTTPDRSTVDVVLMAVAYPDVLGPLITHPSVQRIIQVD